MGRLFAVEGKRFLGARRAFLLLWLPWTLFLGAVLAWLYRAELGDIHRDATAGQMVTVRLARQALVAELAGIGSGVLYLAQADPMRRWLDLGSPGAARAAAEGMLAVIAHRQVYDRGVFIDARSRERIRVEWNGGRPRLTLGDFAASASGGKLIRLAGTLPPGGLHVSSFEFASGDNPGAAAARPVIRIAAPVFDSAGRRRGIVVLDYQGARVLARLREVASQATGDLWLVDADGGWLLGPEAAAERKASFAQAHPLVWSGIHRVRGEGEMAANGGVIAYAVLQPNRLFTPKADMTPANDTAWLVLGRVAPGMLSPQRRAAAERLGLTFMATSVLAALMVWLGTRHEGTLRRMAAALKDGEARLRALLESAPDGIVITDAGGHIVLVNTQTETLFGYAREELLHQPVEILVPESLRDDHRGFRGHFIDAPRTRPMGAGLPLNGRRRDGTEFPVSISLSPIRAGGEALIFADIRDITEQRIAERRIEELNQRLARQNADLAAVNQELEAFSYSVSHDLRAPLRAIDGFSRLLLIEQAAQLEDKGRDRLDRVRRAAQHMAALIDDLLKLSRVTRSELQFRDVDLTALATEVVDELRRHEPDRVANIEIEPGLRAWGDAKLLHIAFVNLLGNAWKFTSNRAAAEIAFGKNDRPGGPVYYIRDNGAGFDMTYAGKLFGAFQRLHDTNEFPGTGIGLATVQRIIHKHGGRIWAKAAVDAGATFHFTLAEEAAE